MRARTRGRKPGPVGGSQDQGAEARIRGQKPGPEGGKQDQGPRAGPRGGAGMGLEPAAQNGRWEPDRGREPDPGARAGPGGGSQDFWVREIFISVNVLQDPSQIILLNRQIENPIPGSRII